MLGHHQRDEKYRQQLCGKRFGTRDADFRSRLRHHDEVRLAHHRAVRAIADRQRPQVT